MSRTARSSWWLEVATNRIVYPIAMPCVSGEEALDLGGEVAYDSVVCEPPHPPQRGKPSNGLVDDCVATTSGFRADRQVP